MRQVKREGAVSLAVVLVALVLYSVYRIEQPTNLDAVAIFQLLETTVTVVGLLAAMFLTVGWRWPIFQGWLVCVPDLTGTWRGVLVPLVTKHGAVTAGDRIPVTILVRQSSFDVRVTLHTAGMDSRSYSGEVFADEESGEQRLTYSYTTDPSLATRESNPRHDGTALLSLRSSGSRELEGHYWTDRLTRGEIHVSFVGRKLNRAIVPE
jgi:hypothetical protein